jgi:preprotein translocase SecE subunit
MALGIRKPSLGYWVRVMSAVFWGALILAAAGWVWNEAQAVQIPVKSYTMLAPSVTGQAAAGSAVSLLTIDETNGALVERGTAVIRSASPTARGTTLVIDTFSSDDARAAAGLAVELGTPAGGAAPGSAGTAFRAVLDSKSTTSTPVFPPLYLQAGLAGVVVLIGAAALYWFVGSGEKTTEFLIATDGEMKKVHWSTARQIRAHTLVVIAAAVLIAALLFGVDTAFVSFFQSIDLLQTGG